MAEVNVVPVTEIASVGETRPLSDADTVDNRLPSEELEAESPEYDGRVVWSTLEIGGVEMVPEIKRDSVSKVVDTVV